MGVICLGDVHINQNVRRMRLLRDCVGRNVTHFLKAGNEIATQSYNRTFEEYYTLAKTTKAALTGKQPQTKGEFTWHGFVNVMLTSEQREAYAAWDVADQDVWDGVATYVASGYKLSLAFNKQNDKFTATLTGQPEAGANSGYAVSGFANDPYSATRVLLFKVACVLTDAWLDYKSDLADDIG